MVRLVPFDPWTSCHVICFMSSMRPTRVSIKISLLKEFSSNMWRSTVSPLFTVNLSVGPYPVFSIYFKATSSNRIWRHLNSGIWTTTYMQLVIRLYCTCCCFLLIIRMFNVPWSCRKEFSVCLLVFCHLWANSVWVNTRLFQEFVISYIEKKEKKQK